MQERRQISKAPLSKYYGDDNDYDNDYDLNDKEE